MKGRKPKERKVIPLTAGVESHAKKAAAMCPKSMRVAVRKYWNVFAEELVRLGRLELIYVPALVELCELYVERERLKKEMADEEIYIIKGRNGEQVKAHPNRAQLNENYRQRMRLIGDFGMTPAAARALSGVGQGELPFDNPYNSVDQKRA